MKPAVIPKKFGINQLEDFFREKFESRYIDLFDTFDEDTIITTEMVDDMILVPAGAELKTIEMVVNSYNRAFLSYLHSLGTLTGTSTEAEIKEVISESDFEDYVRSVYDDPTSYNRINQSSGIRDGVHYIINAESVESDLARIAELEDDTNLSSVLNGYTVLYNNLYREYYTQHTHSMVEELYAQDIQKYGYTF
jgi:hypothetical protein